MPQPFRLPDDPRRAGADVDREIELYLDLRTRELEAEGLSSEEARARALASFGDREAIARECEAVRGETLRTRHRRAWVADLGQDVRGALRQLRRAPGFTATAALTLALGIGGNAAIFSVVRSVLLAPLPYPDADRLVQVWTDERAHGRAAPEWLTPPDFADWERENRTFAAMASYQGWGPDLTGDGEPESLNGAAVSADYFSVLRVRPALGRDFVRADDDPGAERVTIVSDGLWRRRFGADPGLIGRALTLNGEPWTVIGIMPRGFRPPGLAADVWRMGRRPAGTCGRGCIVLRAIGRLRPGATLDQAHQDLAAVAGRLAEQYPQTNEGRGVWLIPLHEQIAGATRPALIALSVAVGLVLLIACVNLANLLLVRGAMRGRELAVRAALGAGRARLVRQLCTESLVLAAIGGALGLGVAVLARQALVSLVPPAVRQVQAIRIDGLVVAFTAALAIGSGLLFGLAPAVSSVRRNLMTALRTGTRSGAAAGKARSGLVVAELALSVTLLVGAGLLLRSFVAMQRLDLGFRTEGLVTANVLFPRARYAEAERAAAAIEDLLTRLRGAPAVAAAEAVDQPPLLFAGDQDIDVEAPGESRPEGGQSVWYRTVSPGYLSLLGFRVLEGRLFADTDRPGAAPVAIVNEAAARRYWHGKSPLGRTLRSGGGGVEATVVGVVANGRPDGPRQPVKPELFLPLGQFPVRGVTVVMASNGSAAAALAALREGLSQVDPLIPISGASSLSEAAGAAVAEPRTYASFVSVFALAALALAAIGVYGVMAFAVAQRQREFGVRLALGAAPGALRRMVLGRSARLVLLGLGLGIVAALVLTRWLQSLLYGVGALDPVTFGAVPLVLALVALLAAWVPAARATRVDPLIAMRDD